MDGATALAKVRSANPLNLIRGAILIILKLILVIEALFLVT